MTADLQSAQQVDVDKRKVLNGGDAQTRAAENAAAENAAAENAPSEPRLLWDQGTAYDFFVSLAVLHEPEEFGLRASWAAGVRSRLSAEDRKILEEAQSVVKVPFHFLYDLQDPKDATSALWALRQVPAEERLPSLTFSPAMDSPGMQGDMLGVLQSVALRQAWDQDDLEVVKEAYVCHKGKALRAKHLVQILDIWKRSGEFGERYLEALQAYYQAFFAEEEQHITEALKDGLVKAQDLSNQVPFPELLEQLSQGVQFHELLNVPELVLVPSYWSTPLVFWGEVTSTRSMVLFGARPASASLVAGEVVPDALLRVLKAIADPTRMRILRYLVHEPLTPSELSRMLRLRAPTVTHHLTSLRLAGLVHLNLAAEDERRYTARLEAIEGMCDNLDSFLSSDQEDINKV